ncbi:Protein of unknown function (DUF3093) [Flavimobilis soli]|uniref:DUF3093 family protein n=1 Tax=Flavimobilis soli TaxID=442709 RepID=A0A2A9EBD1_9MICO|nr:DUF3093 domain-containing protein [Flavimobilis soli]PFG35509.1 Protein of unknown function (DUF3093) [Flavimobilis soli]
MPHAEPSLPSEPVDNPRPAAPATYTERLSPGIWTYGAIALFCVFVFVMIVIASLPIAAGVSLALLVAGSVAAFVTSPVVTVADGHLQAGRARIPVNLLGEPRTLGRAEVAATMGPSFDPRAFACLRTGTGGAVVMDVLDPQDPTPWWLVSTRHPEALASAIRAAQAR